LPAAFGNLSANNNKNKNKKDEKIQIKPKISQGYGAWEKHTKGIGSILLQKYGFNGRLGKAEQGIAEPITTIVRPKNSGLGAAKEDENRSHLQPKNVDQEIIQMKKMVDKNKLESNDTILLEDNDNEDENDDIDNMSYKKKQNNNNNKREYRMPNEYLQQNYAKNNNNKEKKDYHKQIIHDYTGESVNITTLHALHNNNNKKKNKIQYAQNSLKIFIQ